MKITLAQLNFTVGDFAANTAKIIETINKNQKSDLIIFPELCISGYPPEDLVLRQEFIQTGLKFADKVIEATKKSKADILINVPWRDAEWEAKHKKLGKDGVQHGFKREDSGLYNAALIISKGKIIHKQYKYDLPNYGVFDEKRVFSGGPIPKPFKYKGRTIGLLICEDTWNSKACASLKGAEFVISVNASPYERLKHKKRQRIIADAVKNSKAPVFYLNQVTGHDDLVFDGGSLVMAKNGKVFHQFKFFEEDVQTFEVEKVLKSKPANLTKYDSVEHMYRAMCFGLKEYVYKNGFPGVAIGLSGGIDSGLSAVCAVDALGAKNVELVLMPSKFTSQESFDDARALAKNLGVKLQEIDIQPLVDIFIMALKPYFEGRKENIAEENIQARIRGVILMAISNKLGHMVLTTGNKSELATGYATLYGDMCGGYNVLKDLYKTRVYEIANWRNENIPSDGSIRKKNIIPKNAIKRAPSAELRPDQKDEDTLPKYELLDKVLYNLIEMQKSSEDVVKEGYNKKMVGDIEKMIYCSEYKRRQSAPGVKISSKPFGRDRRYPITNKFLD